MNTRTSPLPPELSWRQHPFEELIRLSLPTVLSLLSTSLMTLVDSIFVGHLGSRELAAAGLGGVCVFAVLSFGLAIFGSAKVDVGLQYGAGNQSGLKQSLGGFLRLAIVLGLLSSAVGVLVALALPYLAAEPETGTYAGNYAMIRASGFGFALTSAAIGGWLQAQGNSKSAMKAALLANLLNIPLNYSLIFVFGRGIKGAAWATVASSLVEMLYLLSYQLPKSNNVKPKTGIPKGLYWTQSRATDSWRAFHIGLPTGLERVLDMVAFAAVPLLLAQLGAIHVAAHQIVLQVMLFSFLPVIAFSESVSILISQALGAQQPTLVRKLAKLGLVCVLIYGLLCGFVCVSASLPMAAIFTKDRALIELASSTLRIGALLQLINASYTLLKGVLRGLGQIRYVAWVAVACAWIVSPPLTYVFGVRWGFGAQGAWLVLCLEVSVGALLLWAKVHRALGVQLNPVAR